MRKEELQMILTMASLYTALHQMTNLLDEFCVTSDFPEGFQDDIENFAETSERLYKMCDKYFDGIRENMGSGDKMEDEDLRVCRECEREVPRSEMYWTYDCHGITYRLLCNECWEKAMGNGYDGEYYDECDECLDYSEGW